MPHAARHARGGGLRARWAVKPGLNATGQRNRPPARAVRARRAQDASGRRAALWTIAPRWRRAGRFYDAPRRAPCPGCALNPRVGASTLIPDGARNLRGAVARKPRRRAAAGAAHRLGVLARSVAIKACGEAPAGHRAVALAGAPKAVAPREVGRGKRCPQHGQKESAAVRLHGPARAGARDGGACGARHARCAAPRGSAPGARIDAALLQPARQRNEPRLMHLSAAVDTRVHTPCAPGAAPRDGDVNQGVFVFFFASNPRTIKGKGANLNISKQNLLGAGSRKPLLKKTSHLEPVVKRITMGLGGMVLAPSPAWRPEMRREDLERVQCSCRLQRGRGRTEKRPGEPGPCMGECGCGEGQRGFRPDVRGADAAEGMLWDAGRSAELRSARIVLQRGRALASTRPARAGWLAGGARLQQGSRSGEKGGAGRHG